MMAPEEVKGLAKRLHAAMTDAGELLFLPTGGEFLSYFRSSGCRN